MATIAKVSNNITSFIDRVSGFLVKLLFVVMVALAFTGVVARGIHHSLSWNEELETYLFIWILCIGAALTYRVKGHPAVMFLVERFPKNLSLLATLVSHIAVTVFACIFTWYTLRMSFLEVGETASSMNMPMVYPYMGLPIGGFLFMVYSINFIIQDFSNEKPNLQKLRTRNVGNGNEARMD